jgi:hypothetical protein
MAYSRIKVWIAAEILTASDLNAEHTGHISNENDLDTRLIAEIATRSALETEHDALQGNVWDAGNSQIAANRVGLASMKDNSVGENELATGAVVEVKLAAAIKDGAADTYSARRLGATSLRACAGDDSRLSDTRLPPANGITMAHMQTGSMMLPWFDFDSGTVHDVVADAWADEIKNFRVWIPTDATLIRMGARQKTTSGDGAYGHVRFVVASSFSEQSVTALSSETYTWGQEATLDVSAIAGWQNMKIQMKKSGAGAHSFLQGFSFIWE